MTGVPGAGKTLVGLDAATKHIDTDDELYSVFLSGNGPLVAILQEALARDKVRHRVSARAPVKKGAALSEVKAFIQNVHHFRDECLVDASGRRSSTSRSSTRPSAPGTSSRRSDFMRRKKGRDFERVRAGVSDLLPRPAHGLGRRHLPRRRRTGDQHRRGRDRRVARCAPAIVSGVEDLCARSTPGHRVRGGEAIEDVVAAGEVEFKSELHLATSIRSFRSENVSTVRQGASGSRGAARVTDSATHRDGARRADARP